MQTLKTVLSISFANIEAHRMASVIGEEVFISTGSALTQGL